MLIVLKLFDFTNNLFVALKIELDKVIFSFKIAFVTTINMFSSIVSTNVIESKSN